MFFILFPAVVLWGFWIRKRVSLTNVVLLFTTGSIAAFFLQPFSVASVIAIMGGITILGTTHHRRNHHLPPSPSITFDRDEIITGSISALSFGTLIILAIIHRSGEALRSPWQIATPLWFLLFFFGLLATAKLAYHKSHLTAPSIVLLGIVSTTMALIIFSNGFGFDPFLHRGAIQELVTHGSLHPIRILYSGYYGLIASLSVLFALPVKCIDLLLVPGIAGLLPAVLYRSLLAHHKNHVTAFLGACGLLLAPYSFFTFSIPFSVTALCTIATIAFIHTWRNDSRRQIQFLACNILAIFFHPLLAVPTVLWMIIVLISDRTRWKNIVLIGGTLLIALSIPAMLAFNNLQSGAIPFATTFPWHNAARFFDLFRDPYQLNLVPIPWWLNVLYSYRYWIVPMLSITAMIVPLIHRKFRAIGVAQIPLFLGLFGGVFLIATNLQFADVIWYEQQEFCFRILSVLWLLPLPLAMQTIASFLEHRNKLIKIIIVIITLHATIMWYFSYPHYNEKNLTSGPSVSHSDYEALDTITTITERKPYIALTNQMLSAAAIEQHGFDQNILFDGQSILRYPIPTGGVLYPWFMEMNSYPHRSLAQDIAQRGNVEIVILVVHEYWPYAEDIVSIGAQEADEMLSIENGAITLLVYRFPEAKKSTL